MDQDFNVKYVPDSRVHNVMFGFRMTQKDLFFTDIRNS